MKMITISHLLSYGLIINNLSYFFYFFFLDKRTPAASDDNIVSREPPETMEMSDGSNDSDSEGGPSNDQDGSQILGTLLYLFIYLLCLLLLVSHVLMLSNIIML